MKAPRAPLLVLSALSLALAASSALAADQYIVRVPANVNLVAPETPAPPLDPISVTLSDLALPAGMVGQPYTFNLANRLTLAGGNGEHNDSEAVWSMKAGDTLPAGLALSGGTISGTPTIKNTTGTPFEVIATYKDASGKQIYTIVVNGAILQVTQIAVGAAHTRAPSPRAVRPSAGAITSTATSATAPRHTVFCQKPSRIWIRVSRTSPQRITMSVPFTMAE